MRLGTLTAACLLCLLAVTAQTQPLQIEQPLVLPRDVAVLRPFRVYADPTRPTTETGLRDLSLADVHAAVERFFADDPRFNVVDARTRALARGRTDEQQDLVFIAQQSARLGSEYFRTYNLASAASELEAAEQTYRRTLRALTHPAEVADVYFAIALVEIELARVNEANAATHESRASEALRSVVRLDPARLVDGDRYPPSVVQLWRRAYVSHFVADGAGLDLRTDEAITTADALGVDAVVVVFAMTDGDTTRVSLQMFDRVEERFDQFGSFVVPPTLDAVRDAIEARLSSTVACQQPRFPAIDDADDEEGSVYLSLSFSSATYLNRPTDRLFYSRGARLSLSWMVQETFGLYLSGAQWVASRDPDGELLAAIDSTRGEIGVLAGGRFRRLRVVGHVGFDVSRIGRVRATDAFWCKVSRGEPTEFDALRACDEDEMTDTNPQAQLGFTLGVRTDVQVVGPFFLHASIGTSLTIAPFEGRSLGTPVWLDTGVTYRF